MPKSKKVVKQVKRVKSVKPAKQSKQMKSLKPLKLSNDCKNECVKQYPLEPQFKKITDFYTEQMIELKNLCHEAGVKNLFESNDEKLLENSLPILRNVFDKFKTDINTLKQLLGMKMYGQRMKCILTSCMSGEQMTQLKSMAQAFASMPPMIILMMITQKFLSIARILLNLPSLTLKEIDEQILLKAVAPKKGLAHLQQQCRIYGVLILHTLIKDLMPSCFKVLFPMLLAKE
jgi:hypothetical protein